MLRGFLSGLQFAGVRLEDSMTHHAGQAEGVDGNNTFLRQVQGRVFGGNLRSFNLERLF